MTNLSSRLSRLSAAALVTFLVACGGDAPAPADSATTTEDAAPATDAATPPAADVPVVASNARGEAVYTSNCVSCHQPTGMGLPGAFPPLAGSEWVTGTVDRPIAIVMHGLQGPITVAGNEYNSMMTPWGVGSPLSDDDLAAVLTYVRSSWGNAASAVTADDVARVKAATSSRTGMWTADELQKTFP
jgi:mono/diheme cytochrome c family protein